MHREEQILSCNMPDTDDGVAHDNEDEESVAMIEESPSGCRVNKFPLGIYFALFFFSLNFVQPPPTNNIMIEQEEK